jgi:putative redox protein
MTNSSSESPIRAQAVVAGYLSEGGALSGRAGGSEFPVGGLDGRRGTATGPNPYDLLSASLAACTAMTIRLQARREKFPLSHVEVAVSYHHGFDGGRDSFDRAITLEGLDDRQREVLMQAAAMCPVGKTLGLTADIRTRDSVRAASASAPANYEEDLRALPIPYIDAD